MRIYVKFLKTIYPEYWVLTFELPRVPRYLRLCRPSLCRCLPFYINRNIQIRRFARNENPPCSKSIEYTTAKNNVMMPCQLSWDRNRNNKNKIVGSLPRLLYRRRRVIIIKSSTFFRAFLNKHELLPATDR